MNATPSMAAMSSPAPTSTEMVMTAYRRPASYQCHSSPSGQPKVIIGRAGDKARTDMAHKEGRRLNMTASLPWQANARAFIYYTETHLLAMNASAINYKFNSIPGMPAGPQPCDM